MVIIVTLEVARSTPLFGTWASCSHTHVPLTPSTTKWIQSWGNDVLRPGA